MCFKEYQNSNLSEIFYIYNLTSKYPAMKKIIITLTCIVLAMQLFAQTTSNATSKEYYLKKSKTQKTIAWVMAGAGAALITTGLIIGTNYAESNNPLNAIDKSAGPVILIVTGSASALGSIPLFISSAKNKKRAASVSLLNQHILMPQQNSIAFNMQPALSLKISL